jgi:predicted phosphoribosyltransferase
MAGKTFSVLTPRVEHGNAMRYILHELTQFRNKHHIFSDRSDAGRFLAEMLAPEYTGIDNGIILAIPSGGIPVGLEIARRLRLPFDLMIVRKLQIPGNTEAGFGAMGPDGRLFLNEEILRHLRLTDEQIESQAAIVREELRKRNSLFRGDQPLPVVAGKTVILVDDGLASGYTMLAAAAAVRDGKAAGIVMAVPTALVDSIEKVGPLADEVYCANVLDFWPFAVANAYRQWRDLSRQEVVELLGSPPELRN